MMGQQMEGQMNMGYGSMNQWQNGPGIPQAMPSPMSGMQGIGNNGGYMPMTGGMDMNGG
jgi:hypothetical protein